MISLPPRIKADLAPSPQHSIVTQRDSSYVGHEDNRRGSRSMGAMATYVRAGLPEVATALAALTGEPHPLAIKDPGISPADEYRD